MMFEIRRAQVESMILADEESFLNFICDHLRKHSADLVAGIPDDLLREMCRNGIARARTHGLTKPGDLNAFVTLMFEVAPNFDERPAIRAALRSKSIPPDRRIDLLWDRVPDSEWVAAAEDYDERTWFPEVGIDDGDLK